MGVVSSWMTPPSSTELFYKDENDVKVEGIFSDTVLSFHIITTLGGRSECVAKMAAPMLIFSATC